jgi:membrane protein
MFLMNPLNTFVRVLPLARTLLGSISLFRSAILKFVRNDGGHQAAGLAYYILLSIFPFLLGTVAFAGFFMNPEEVEIKMLAFLGRGIPEEIIGETLRDNVTGRTYPQGAAGFLSAFVFIMAARAGFSALQRNINRAWLIKSSQSFFRQRIRETAMALTAVFIFLAAVFMGGVGLLAAEGLGSLGRFLNFMPWIWGGPFAILPLVLTSAGFFFVFKFVPERNVPWRTVVPVAVLIGVIFEFSKVLFLLFLDNVAAFDEVYGSISAVIVLVVWIYIVCLLVGIGAALNHEITEAVQRGWLRRKLGHRSVEKDWDSAQND